MIRLAAVALASLVAVSAAAIAVAVRIVTRNRSTLTAAEFDARFHTFDADRYPQEGTSL